MLGKQPQQKEKTMKKDNTEEKEDELRSEYDLKSLRVRRLGPGRQSFGAVVRLTDDVAEVFPNAESVNEALRFLIRITKDKRRLFMEEKARWPQEK